MEEFPVQKEKFYGAIIEIMSDGIARTAREVSIVLKEKYFLGDGTRQSAAPRITELEDKGLLVTVDKKFDSITRKYVRTYEKGDSVLSVIANTKN